MTMLKIGNVKTARHVTAGRRGQLQKLREIYSYTLFVVQTMVRECTLLVGRQIVNNVQPVQ